MAYCRIKSYHALMMLHLLKRRELLRFQLLTCHRTPAARPMLSVPGLGCVRHRRKLLKHAPQPWLTGPLLHSACYAGMRGLGWRPLHASRGQHL